MPNLITTSFRKVAGKPIAIPLQLVDPNKLIRLLRSNVNVDSAVAASSVDSARIHSHLVAILA
jgi:hypothetical protein